MNVDMQKAGAEVAPTSSAASRLEIQEPGTASRRVKSASKLFQRRLHQRRTPQSFVRCVSKLRAAVCWPKRAIDGPLPSLTPAGPEIPDANNADESEIAEEEEALDAEKGQIMRSEIIFLDRRFDHASQPYYTERKKDDIDKSRSVEKTARLRLSAFSVVRVYDEEDALDETYLHVNPQPLRQLLKDVIGDYPTDPIDGEDVQISAPYHSLFHYRKQIEAVGSKRFLDNKDSVSICHLNLLIGWIKQNFELEIVAHQRCLEGDSKAIAYDKLWTLFAPGSTVYAKLLSHDRAFKVFDYFYDTLNEESAFKIRTIFVDYDGKRFGHLRTNPSISKYTGVRAVSSHDVIPFDFVDSPDEVRQRLVERGKRFEQLATGQNFVEYKGIAFKKNEQGTYLRFDATGRAMIDCKTYHRIDANDSFTVHPLDYYDKQDRQDGKMTDDDRLITTPCVRGYSMLAKKFLELSLENITPIVWNSKCFEDIVLDADTKRTVQALVSTHSKQQNAEEGFDDIVKGKGRGLVGVLHGPPGVGKTLTAEVVAEYVQRPLFMVSSGDLGSSSVELDRKLTSVMEMTSTWRAVLLIDEADIFLEARATHDVHRNALVSVFLRVLEYYAGIILLTTNRVATFDDAFKSRIHIPIRYTELSRDSRLQMWRTFCARVPGGVRITDKEYDEMAKIELNGRQIKNAIKTAESLARFDGVQLDHDKLQQVTKLHARFEKDLETFSGPDYTASGAKRIENSNSMFN